MPQLATLGPKGAWRDQGWVIEGPGDQGPEVGTRDPNAMDVGRIVFGGGWISTRINPWNFFHDFLI